jgi:hypothetical protein
LARLRRRRAKPFLINIRCGIPIPLMGRAAAWTGPQPITQGEVIRKILCHLKLAADPPPIAPVRVSQEAFA